MRSFAYQCLSRPPAYINKHLNYNPEKQPVNILDMTGVEPVSLGGKHKLPSRWHALTEILIKPLQGNYSGFIMKTL